MVSASLFKRPDGIRDGIGNKPLAVRSRTLSGANPSIKLAGAATTIRLTQTSTASGSCVMQRGPFDGLALTLVSVSNSGSAVLPSSTASNTSLPNGTWAMDEGSTLSLVWDGRESIWRETSRSDVVANNVVLIDDTGAILSTGVTNGNNELSVSDAVTEETLSALLKEQKRTNELLEKLLKKGKGST